MFYESRGRDTFWGVFLTAVHAELVVSASDTRLFGLETKMLGSAPSVYHAIGYIIKQTTTTMSRPSKLVPETCNPT
jgi:hypothetical protein